MPTSRAGPDPVDEPVEVVDADGRVIDFVPRSLMRVGELADMVRCESFVPDSLALVLPHLVGRDE